MSRDDGGGAFPVVRTDITGNRGNYMSETYSEGGMTLRDYFAAKALEAILRALDRGIKPQDCISAAEDAYFIADAMLKARNK
jgi:hypothetical protein